MENIKLDNQHIIALKSSHGLRLYGVLKSHDKWEFEKDMIRAMMELNGDNTTNTELEHVLDKATQDINTRTDLQIEYKINGNVIKFKLIC